MRKGAGATLRRGAASIENDVPGPDTDSPWDRVVLRRDRLVEELLALGPDVVVESPGRAARGDRLPAPRDRGGFGVSIWDGGSMTPASKRPAVASGAKDQVARLLTLVPYLHSHPQVRLDETAAAVGSTPEQVVKDLGVLLMCGLPGGYPDDLIDVDLDALEDPEDGSCAWRA